MNKNIYNLSDSQSNSKKFLKDIKVQILFCQGYDYEQKRRETETIGDKGKKPLLECWMIIGILSYKNSLLSCDDGGGGYDYEQNVE